MTKKKETLPVNWEEMFAVEAKEVAALERPAVANIGFRGGIMTYAGNEIPDNSITGIVVSYTVEHTYYPDKFDPDTPVAPACFAQALPQDAGRDGGSMQPHETCPDKQADSCGECPMLEWGSSPTGAGKACKQIRKLAFIPFNDGMKAEQIATAEVGMAKVPVTSVKNWKNYINRVAAVESRPPWAVITTMRVKPHAKYQLVVEFDLVQAVSDEYLGALNERIPKINDLLLSPYMYEEVEDQPEGRKKY